MSVVLSPDRPQVDQGVMLSLVVRTEGTNIIHKQFTVKRSFDYSDFIEQINREGLIKTDEVFVRLSDLLIKGDYVEPVESYILDLGLQGRASSALKECREYSLNNDACKIKNLIKDLEKQLFSFNGPEGTLHVLKADTGETLGQVTVMFDTESGILRKMVLDVVGPGDADFPWDFRQDIEYALKHHIVMNHPDINSTMTVRVQRSELAIATSTLLEQC